MSCAELAVICESLIAPDSMPNGFLHFSVIREWGKERGGKSISLDSLATGLANGRHRQKFPGKLLAAKSEKSADPKVRSGGLAVTVSNDLWAGFQTVITLAFSCELERVGWTKVDTQNWAQEGG